MKNIQCTFRYEAFLFAIFLHLGFRHLNLFLLEVIMDKKIPTGYSKNIHMLEIDFKVVLRKQICKANLFLSRSGSLCMSKGGWGVSESVTITWYIYKMVI